MPIADVDSDTITTWEICSQQLQTFKCFTKRVQFAKKKYWIWPNKTTANKKVQTEKTNMMIMLYFCEHQNEIIKHQIMNATKE